MLGSKTADGEGLIEGGAVASDAVRRWRSGECACEGGSDDGKTKSKKAAQMGRCAGAGQGRMQR